MPRGCLAGALGGGMLGGIIKALLEWLTGLFRHELKADKTASDGEEIPAHIRERLANRLRKHPGSFHRVGKTQRDNARGSGRKG